MLSTSKKTLLQSTHQRCKLFNNLTHLLLVDIMPRTYTRKTNRANYTEQQLRNAAQPCIEDKASIRQAALLGGVNRLSLARYIQNRKHGYTRCASVNRIFSDTQEHELASHIKSLDDCFHGLSREKTRILANEYAKANQITVPSNWTTDGKAGEQIFDAKLNE